MNCNICGKPVVLVPSAKERSRKYGDKPASFYTKLFPTHTKCQLDKNAKETSRLIKSLN